MGKDSLGIPVVLQQLSWLCSYIELKSSHCHLKSKLSAGSLWGQRGCCSSLLHGGDTAVGTPCPPQGGSKLAVMMSMMELWGGCDGVDTAG